MRRPGHERFGTRPHRVSFHGMLYCHPVRDVSMVFFLGRGVRAVRPTPRRTQPLILAFLTCHDKILASSISYTDLHQAPFMVHHIILMLSTAGLATL